MELCNNLTLIDKMFGIAFKTISLLLIVIITYFLIILSIGLTYVYTEAWKDRIKGLLEKRKT